MTTRCGISIIIPVLNEALGLASLTESLAGYCQQGLDIVIVDGGSTDSTLASLDVFQKKYPQSVQILAAQKGRALQMNKGAHVANGDVLLFLHADTVLPPNVAQVIHLALRHKLWGRFDIRLSGSQGFFRVIEFCINVRSRLTGIATGDQAIFVKKTFFEAQDRFAQIPIMEDVDWCKRACKISQPVCLKEKVISSSRRWEQYGMIKTIFLMWKLRFLFGLGMAPRKLVQRYRY